MKRSARSEMRWMSCLLTGLLAALLVACSDAGEPRVEKIGEPPALLPYRLDSLTGVRDGDLMKTRLVFTSEAGRLAVEMNFRIGVPTILESGRYTWDQRNGRTEGSVNAISVTFLGGQSDGPSIGGIFQLLGPDNAPLHKITLPTRVVPRS